MSYEYGSESKRLELPNPYQLQNRLLWVCGAVLLIGGVTSLWWAKAAMQENALRLAGAPLVAGIVLLVAGLACVASAAGRLRFFSGAAGRRRSPPRSRSVRAAARRPPTSSRSSCARAVSPTLNRRVRSKGCCTTGRRP